MLKNWSMPCVFLKKKQIKTFEQFPSFWANSVTRQNLLFSKKIGRARKFFWPPDFFSGRPKKVLAARKFVWPPEKFSGRPRVTGSWSLGVHWLLGGPQGPFRRCPQGPFRRRRRRRCLMGVHIISTNRICPSDKWQCKFGVSEWPGHTPYHPWEQTITSFMQTHPW